MRNPFNKEEIKSAVKKLNNNKSAGPDDIFAEELKNCPDIVFDLIADMFNKVANNGESLKELNEGFLVPLLKPGKAKGSVENLRPIILFNIIRKLLCNVILNRIRLRLEKVIPISQAAYRKGRSTTENVCAMKLLIDKALIEKNFSLDLLLLDMSKAFDSVNRENLMSDLRNILESDELNIINLLINEVKLKVKNKDNIGNFFDTNIGVPQGDSLSPILFTLYLANTLSDKKFEIVDEDIIFNYKLDSDKFLPNHIKDHNYSSKRSIGVNIDMQYAGDVSWLTTCHNKILDIEKD